MPRREAQYIPSQHTSKGIPSYNDWTGIECCAVSVHKYHTYVCTVVVSRLAAAPRLLLGKLEECHWAELQS